MLTILLIIISMPLAYYIIKDLITTDIEVNDLPVVGDGRLQERMNARAYRVVGGRPKGVLPRIEKRISRF